MQVSLTMIALVYTDQVPHGHRVPLHHCIGGALSPPRPRHQVPARESLHRSGLLSTILALSIALPWDHFPSDDRILFR